MPLASRKQFITSLTLFDTDLQDFKTKFKKSQNTIKEETGTSSARTKIGKLLILEG